MTPADLRAWQAAMGYTYESAAEALGMSRGGYAKLVGGVCKIDRRTALACAAVAEGLAPWSPGKPPHKPLAGRAATTTPARA